MNRNRYLLALILGVPVLASAGSVDTFPAKGVDITQFKTFKMLPTRVLAKTGVLENDPDVSPFINASLRKALTEKGLREVPDDADLDVAAGALSVAIPHVDAVMFDVGGMGADWGSTPIATVGRYNHEGTLFVNLINPKTKKSVWMGIATRGLGKQSNLDKDVEKATQSLFKKYPSVK
jgi:hypothetical protein